VALAGILSILSANRATGAELYGTFTAGNSNIFRGAKVEVKCGDWEKMVPVASSGKTNLRGIPDGRGCYLTVHHPDYRQSPGVQFNTGKSVVTLNAELRIIKNQIILFRR
jgi:hypothetical protein